MTRDEVQKKLDRDLRKEKLLSGERMTADLLLDFSLPRNAFDLIARENLAQLEKWGCQCHSMSEWLMFATEEHGELAKAISEYLYRDGDIEDIEKEAAQAATLSLKIAWMCKLMREEV